MEVFYLLQSFISSSFSARCVMMQNTDVKYTMGQQIIKKVDLHTQHIAQI